MYLYNVLCNHKAYMCYPIVSSSRMSKECKYLFKKYYVLQGILSSYYKCTKSTSHNIVW